MNINEEIKNWTLYNLVENLTSVEESQPESICYLLAASYKIDESTT